MGWIYAFQDERYEKGVKVGWDGSGNGLGRFEKASSYSPAKISYLAAWEFTGKQTKNEYEAIEDLARKGFHQLTFPNNGKEWLDVSTVDCILAVSDNLGRAAQKLEMKKYMIWDDFRSPRKLDAPCMDTQKQVLWVYVEHLTGRVKVQRIDEWQTPREVRKTYSRNGFAPVAGVTYSGNVSRQANLAIHALWEEILRKFGAPIDNATFGWLPERVTAGEVIAYLSDTTLDVMLPPFSAEPPLDVRRYYNK